jgi:hypothetical protein
MFMLTGVGLVRKMWSATAIGFVAGIVGLALPGGPGVLDLPMLVITGIVVDLFLASIGRGIGDSIAVAAAAGWASPRPTRCRRTPTSGTSGGSRGSG